MPFNDDMTYREPTELEALQSHYSDYHKDLYGFRPRYDADEVWNSVEGLRARIAQLDEAAPAIWAAEKAESDRCIAQLEARIADVIASGAKDRETAIRWIGDAEGYDGDLEYLCYLVGVPYRYFTKAA